MFKVKIEGRVFRMSAEELEKAIERQPAGRTIHVLDLMLPQKAIRSVGQVKVLQSTAASRLPEAGKWSS